MGSELRLKNRVKILEAEVELTTDALNSLIKQVKDLKERVKGLEEKAAAPIQVNNSPFPPIVYDSGIDPEPETIKIKEGEMFPHRKLPTFSYEKQPNGMLKPVLKKEEEE
jgi:hypothetical protein